MRALFWLLLFPGLMLFSGLALAHPGGVDRHGGHTDRSSGHYHCHREPCQSAQQQQRDALEEARQQGRAFPCCTTAATGRTGVTRMATAATPALKC